MEIRKINFNTLFTDKNWPEIEKKYMEEGKPKHFPDPKTAYEYYAKMEQVGLSIVYGAYAENDNLIGFMTVVTCIYPHYSVYMTNVESIFVLKEYRKYKTAFKLLNMAKKTAKELNAYGIVITAAMGGPLEKILPLYKFECTHASWILKL